MNYSKEQIKNAIIKGGVIAIIRGVEEDKIIPLLNAIIKGGVTVAEITFCADNDNIAPRLIEKAIKELGDKLIIGAGTVSNLARAKTALDSGANFFVTPNVNGEVISFAKQNNRVIISGALTPSEIHTAYYSGADLVKVFPADAFGAKYFKAVKAPMPEIPLLAFSGITEANVGEYIKAGAVGAGISSELVHMPSINSGNFEYITQKAKGIIEQINLAKNS